MPHRPLGLSVLVWIFVTAPLVKLFYLSQTTGHPLGYTLTKLIEIPIQSPTAWLNFLLFWVLSPLCGYCLFRIQKRTLYAYLILQSGLGVAVLIHLISGSVGPIPAHFPLKLPQYTVGMQQLEILYLSIGFMTGIYLSFPRVKSLLAGPSQRWWETRKRYETLALFRSRGVGRNKSQEQTGQILEVSLYGAFLRFNKEDEIRLLPGEKFTLNICEDWFHLPNLEAVVVHTCSKRGRNGYGVKLLPKGIWQKYQLEKLVSLIESGEFGTQKIRTGWSFP